MPGWAYCVAEACGSMGEAINSLQKPPLLVSLSLRPSRSQSPEMIYPHPGVTGVGVLGDLNPLPETPLTLRRSQPLLRFSGKEPQQLTGIWLISGHWPWR